MAYKMNTKHNIHIYVYMCICTCVLLFFHFLSAVDIIKLQTSAVNQKFDTNRRLHAVAKSFEILFLFRPFIKLPIT